jgi:hypothetical protein
MVTPIGCPIVTSSNATQYRVQKTRVVLSLEDFSGAAPSLWIWFYAIAETPEAALASRESLIGELHRALVDERFTSFFEEERDDAERTYP